VRERVVVDTRTSEISVRDDTRHRYW
jgi:hypothetical protein